MESKGPRFFFRVSLHLAIRVHWNNGAVFSQQILNEVISLESLCLEHVFNQFTPQRFNIAPDK